MGHLNEKHDLTLLGKTPPGTCPECATVHEPDQPHNQESLAYQYKFYDAHGRWPTWGDAMAHCPSEVKAFWIETLMEHGIDVNTLLGVEAEIEIEIKLGEDGLQ